MNFEEAIQHIANEKGQSVEEVTASIDADLQATKGTDAFKEIFGDKIPTTEEFMMTIIERLYEIRTAFQ